MESESLSEQLRAKLLEMANKDGVVTDEEHEFIEKILEEFSVYETKLKSAIEDGVIDKQEQVSLFQARLALIAKAVNTIRKDNMESDDEKLLFHTFQTFIPDIQSYEAKFHRKG